MDAGSLHDLRERLAQICTVYAILIQEQPSEDRVVQLGTCAVDGSHVQLTDVGCQPDAVLEHGGARGKRSPALVKIVRESDTIFAEPIEPFTNLVLREALLCEVDQSLFALVQVCQFPLKGGMQLPDAGLLVRHGAADAVHDHPDKLVAEVERAVVPDDEVLDQFGW